MAGCSGVHSLLTLRLRAAAIRFAILLVAGLLVQLISMRFAHNSRSKLKTTPRLRCTVVKNVTDLNANKCRSYLRLESCLSKADWTFSPPARLQAACRRAAAGGASEARPLVLVFVPTDACMARQRTTIRQTWGSGFELVAFLVQLSQDETTIPGLEEEAAKFDDIFVARGPFKDSYECLTLKLLAFLRWYLTNCRRAFHYLLKSDHDSYWSADSLQHLLRQRLLTLSRAAPANNSNSQESIDLRKSSSVSPPAEILGCIQDRAVVQRGVESKFCTPLEAYSANEYPTYSTGGPGYLISDEAAASLTEAADRLAPFWLEDVYITGMLAATSKQPVRHSHLSHVHYVSSDSSLSYSDVLNQPPLGTHGLTEEQLRRLHTWMSEPQVKLKARKVHWPDGL